MREKNEQILDNATRERWDNFLRYNTYGLSLEMRRMRDLRRPEYPAAVQFIIDTLKQRWDIPEDRVIHIDATIDPLQGFVTFSPAPAMKEFDTMRWAGNATLHPDALPPEAKPKTKIDRLVGMLR